MTDERRPEARDGDPAVDATWRRASSELPPRHVDDTILAAARAAVRDETGTRPRPVGHSWWTGWHAFAAAAGVAGLAFVLARVVPREEAAPPPASVPAPATERAAPRAPEAAGATMDTAKASAPVRSPESRPTASVSAPARSMTNELAAAAPSPEEWARRIASLHADGDLAAAASELKAFRAACPGADERLPGALRAWAGTVPTTDAP